MQYSSPFGSVQLNGMSDIWGEGAGEGLRWFICINHIVGPIGVSHGRMCRNKCHTYIMVITCTPYVCMRLLTYIMVITSTSVSANHEEEEIERS